MFILIICMFGAALAIAGIVLYFMAKTPKQIPKKYIVEAIIGAADELLPYRQEIRRLIGDGLNLYQQHDSQVLTQRYGTVDRRKQDMDQKLSAADKNLAAYKSAKAHGQFYELANTTIVTLRQTVDGLAKLKGDSAAFEPIIVALQHLSTLAQSSALIPYIADGDNAAAIRVVDHVNVLIASADQTIAQITVTQFQTDEFRQVAQSVSTSLKKTAEDYTRLRDLLSGRQYNSYRDALQSLPHFFTRFDTSGYESIVTAMFSQQPEASYINDLRSHLYN